MTLSTWELNGHLAQLHSDQLSAEVDLARPAGGVFHLRVSETHFKDLHILGIDMPSHVLGEADALADAYVRSADLAASYDASRDWPVRVDAVWRGGNRSSHHEFVAAIELLVSVRTDSLNSQPRMTVESTFSGGEVALATDRNADRFEPFISSTVDSASSGQDACRGCIVFRPAGSDLSYVEMVHPLDFRRDELLGGGKTPFRVRHHLFDESLEKGVVLRARLRGVFVPRGNDTRLASEQYAAFRAAEPPLGP
jgi:hypothetical protein